MDAENTRDGYTADQAQQLLAFIEVKMPGTLTAAEQTLRKYGKWPEDTDDDGQNGDG